MRVSSYLTRHLATLRVSTNDSAVYPPCDNMFGRSRGGTSRSKLEFLARRVVSHGRVGKSLQTHPDSISTLDTRVQLMLPASSE